MASQAMGELAPERLIERIYGALAEDVSFEGTLRVAAEAFRSHVSGLHAEDFGVHRGRLTLIGGIDATDYAAFNADYNARWAGQNLWMERSLRGFLDQGYQHGDAVVPAAELLRSPYYVHFLRPLDIRYGLGIRIWSDDASTMAIASFHRPRGERGFDIGDVARVRALRPHLASAYAIYRRTLALEARVASLRAALDRSPYGVFALDDDGRALEWNAAAERFVFDSAIARLVRRRLVFAASATHRVFRDALRRMASDGAMPASLALARPNAPQRPLVMHLCRIPPGRLEHVHASARLLAFVAELEASEGGDLAAHALQAVLGITPAEARTAIALRRHIEIDAVARACGVSIATVRVHVKRLHEKLGVGRNLQLLAMVERVIASMPAAG